MLGSSWGIWWGLALERPAPASLPDAVLRDQEAAGLIPAGTRAQLRGVAVTRRTRRTLRPELVITPGPRVLGVPGAGSLGELYGATWALGVYASGPQLLQARAGVWVDRTDPDALTMPADAAHVALAWDQAARPVLAYSTAAGLYVRRYDTTRRAYVVHGPLPGVDPCLMADAPLSGDVAGSDIVLWHLTADRAALAYRLQRDNYATAYPVAAELTPGAVLDQVVMLPLRAELLGELPDGQPWAVVAGLYPVTVRELARGAARPAAGSYLPAVGAASGAEPPAYGTATPQGGRYQAVVVQSSAAEPPAYGTATPQGGRYQAVVVQSNAAEPPAYGVAVPRPGRYFLGLIRYTAPVEPPIYGSATPGAGSYSK